MLYVNFSVKCLRFALKWSFFLFSAYFGGHYVTTATVNVESIPGYYTLAIALAIALIN